MVKGERFDKVMISVYTKEKLEEEDYNTIKRALKETTRPEGILNKEFSTFNKIVYNDKFNRYCLYFDDIDEYSYQCYIKVLRVEKLKKI